ncbi:FAD/NAD(P)-binding domain-containing protein [Hypomontagnella submonticulosa]|nr:FAD/NAD(P)-binding domain-containing protein [Hypomontagnella submonticulosa]
MKSIIPSSSLFLVMGLLAPHCQAQHHNVEVITRDIAIIGGGATGTYAAINLKDQGKSIVVIERNTRLGGHTATYQDPATRTPINFGVQIYYDDPITRAFFTRLNISVGPAKFVAGKTPLYLDFTDGSPIAGYSIPPLGADYIQELHKYPYLENGIELPDPVPEDLLLPWSEYLVKLNITDEAITTYSRPAVAGDLTKILALYVFNNLNHIMIEEQTQGKTLANVNGDLSEPFRNALAELGSDVFLNSTVTRAVRGSKPADGVDLYVSTPQGMKRIIAKQLVFAAPPVLDNLKPFNLDKRESNIISKFEGGFYYTGVVTNLGLPTNHTYINRGQKTEWHLASLPGVSMFNPTFVEGTYYYWYSSLSAMTQEQVESSTRNTLKRLQKTVPGANASVEPQFVAYASHTPLHPTADADAVRNGVYRDMDRLQGYRNTWYTASLTVTGSSQLWNITSQLLPRIIAASEK